MKNFCSVKALADSYKQQLVLAIEEKTSANICDPGLDLLILSLVERLEVLEWVLDDGGAVILPATPFPRDTVN